MELGYAYYKTECSKCHRPILVEIGLNGSSHNAAVQSTCAACLDVVDPQFRVENPDAAADIEQWLKETRVARGIGETAAP